MAHQQAATAEAEPTSRFLEAHGLRLHYLDWGGDPSKHTFLLLHGGSAHVHWWDYVAPLLTAHGRVLALDFRGHGHSQWSRPPSYGPQAYVADTVALIESLGTRVVLVGHSMGGAVAQWVAALHGEMLEALIVVDSPHGPPPLRRRLMWRWRRRAAGKKERPILRTADDIKRRFRLSPPDTYLTAERLERLALQGAEQLKDGSWAFLVDPQTRAWRRTAGMDLRRPNLKSLGLPVLILRGAQSTLISRRHARAMNRRIRGSAYREIPRAYHHVPLDNPDDTAAAIIAFVESPPTRP